jgi:hypothetical protein
MGLSRPVMGLLYLYLYLYYLIRVKKKSFKKLSTFIAYYNTSIHVGLLHCQSDEGEAGMNRQGLAVWKGAHSPTMLHMFLYFSVPSLSAVHIDTTVTVRRLFKVKK